ncbi:hypothetical protein ACFPIJ_36330 [Dactylosporangium cerinum]|uniref:Uncharacterized protein n=1 Tax=Dactylosporangium cerinum TaxID=1434730 RepID=A0ABV9W7I3_9ACTN
MLGSSAVVGPLAGPPVDVLLLVVGRVVSDVEIGRLAEYFGEDQLHTQAIGINQQAGDLSGALLLRP